MTPRFALPGSDRREIQPHAVVHPLCHPDERAEVTIRLTTDDDSGVRAAAQWAISQKLLPTFSSPAQRLAKAQGSLANLESAFGVTLHVRETPDTTHRAHYGPVFIPEILSNLIASVHGLDNRQCATPRIARSMHRSHVMEGELHWHAIPPAVWGLHKYSRPPGTFTPIEVAKAYEFPEGDGHGEIVALIELGGGYRPADLTAYWEYLGIEGPVVTSIGVNGARNQPGSRADEEVMLDVETVGSIANKAKIFCVFAGNSERDFLDALSASIHSVKASVVSISWGGPENSFSDAAKDAFNRVLKEAADLHVTVLVAAGDAGSDDGESDGRSHVDFPASSPYATAVGGTKLVVNGSTIDETVWNEGKDGITGGGCSEYFKRAEYQTSFDICDGMQGVPDIAALADPATGCVIRVDGRFEVCGGTSMAAPMVAACIARINQIRGKRTGALSPILYANPSVCRDVTRGSNGAFNAGTAWDACTGLGVINGTRLLEALK